MKICILGAGKRVHEMYIPVLQSLQDVQVVGCWNRTRDKAKILNQVTSWPSYDDKDQMIKDCKPDAILVVVNAAVIKDVVLDLIDYGVPIIMETPVLDVMIPEASIRKNTPVFVNEQTPYLPCEDFKVQLIESNVFGTPTVAVNDFRTFEYHGIAQLRRYLGYEKKPSEVVGMCTDHIPVSYKDNNGNLQNHMERWEFGTIKFSSGQTAVYNFSSIYNRAAFRKPRSMRIYCTAGTICNDDNEFLVHKLNNDGSSEKVEVEVIGEYMNTSKLTATVNGKTITWEREKNLSHLNDQQMAIRTIFSHNLKAVEKKDVSLGYTSASAFLDVNLLNAIRHSSQIKKFLQ